MIPGATCCICGTKATWSNYEKWTMAGFLGGFLLSVCPKDSAKYKTAKAVREALGPAWDEAKRKSAGVKA